MLRSSTSWDSVATPVTWTVTLLSWLLVGLDMVAVFVIRSFSADANVFARIITWNYHPGAAIFAAVLATFVMAITAAATGGLRRANLVWLRVWVAGLAASGVAIASTLLALTLGLLFVLLGVAVGVILLVMLVSAIDL